MRLAAAVGSASATAALAAPASAQPDAPAKPRGVYVTFEGGAGWLHRMAVRCAHGTRHSSLGTKTGYGLGGAVGYAFGNGVRLEAEVPYRSNGAGALVAGSTSEPISGSVSSVALMFNALYDIAAVRVGRFTPYVGAGVGVARVSADDLGAQGVTLVRSGSNRFAYQAIVGVSGALTRAWSIHIDYRYFATDDPTFKTVGGESFASQYRSQSVMVGGTYHFGP